MAKNPSPTLLDQNQILQRSFDQANDRLRVDASVTATIAGPFAVEIQSSNDNIAIRNSSNSNELLINADGSINANIEGTLDVSISAGTGDSIAISDGEATLDINKNGSINTEVYTRRTYVSTAIDLVPASEASDILTIQGAEKKLVRISKISISGTQRNPRLLNFLLIKRSGSNDGGDPIMEPIASMDNGNASPGAVVRAYNVNPSLASSNGIIRATKVFIGDTTEPNVPFEWNFPEVGSQQPILKSPNDYLCLNLNGATLEEGSFTLYIEWTEEDN